MTAAMNRYQLQSRIATGGMGEVWRARDTVLGREVAVKVLKPEYAGDATFRTRFETEARHAASLHHPNIATVFDFGEEESEDGAPPRPYLVMELVPGKPLSDLIQRGRPMAPERVRDLVSQSAAGLAQAHALGIVHRDVKPANLLVTPDGQVKVTDFGIARAADGVALTSTGEVIGTPHYLSPEQAEGRPATPASDVYALGVVLFECLSGSRPFAGDTPVTTALAHVRDPMPDLPPDIPEDLARVTRRALAKNPADRYPDAGGLAAALGGAAEAPAADATRVMAAPTALLAEPAAPVPTTPPPPPPADADQPPRRRAAGWVLAVLGVLALVLAVVLALVLGRNSSPGTTAQSPSATASTSPKSPKPSASATTSSSTTPKPTARIVPGDYVGLSTQAAEAELGRLGFSDVDTVPRDNPGDQKPGTVADTSPTGTVRKDAPVTLTVWGDPTPSPSPSSPTATTPSPSSSASPTGDSSRKGNNHGPGSGHAKQHKEKKPK
ncbi:MAG: serine/threonine protein kinase [Marmoricola sp.]